MRGGRVFPILGGVWIQLGGVSSSSGGQQKIVVDNNENNGGGTEEKTVVEREDVMGDVKSLTYTCSIL